MKVLVTQEKTVVLRATAVVNVMKDHDDPEGVAIELFKFMDEGGQLDWEEIEDQGDEPRAVILEED
jgi:hypothetical protein